MAELMIEMWGDGALYWCLWIKKKRDSNGEEN